MIWPASKQPYAALVCRLMVSNPVIGVITRITTHLPTLEDGRLSRQVLHSSQLLGTLSSKLPTGVLPLDSSGGFPFPRAPHLAPFEKFLDPPHGFQ